MRLRRILSCLAPILAPALAGCGESGGGASRGASSSAGVSSGIVIPMVVVRSPGGTAAFVRLTVKGRSFIFKVDTGAAGTVVDAAVAKALALPKRGRAFSAPTVGCQTSAQPVEVSDWKLGGRRLPAMRIFSARALLAGPAIHGTAVGGLLGSDVLSRYGTATLDFADKRLILGGKAPTGRRVIAMSVEHNLRNGVYETVGVTIGSTSEEFAIDSGASTSLIQARTAAQLRLATVGKSLTAYGAAGCSATVTPVRIAHWRAGHVPLPPTVAVSSNSSAIEKLTHGPIAGLIGADVLDTFGLVTIDFADKRLVLAAPSG